MSSQKLENAGRDMHGYHVQLLHDMSAVKDEWRALAATKTSTAYQSYEWIEVALRDFETGNQPVILFATKGAEPQFIIPLVLEPGFLKILRWPGNNHANICCGLYSKEFLSEWSAELIKDLFQFAQETLNTPLLLHLKNQPIKLAGFDNPLLTLQHQAGPNPLFAIDLTEGFDAILDLGNGKRKRKLFRRQCRVAEKLGGYELFIPQTRSEISFILSEFFRLKTARLKTLGVSDVFAPDEAREFLTSLAMPPESGGDPALRFFVLNVDGKMRAMYGACVVDTRCYSFINAVEYDAFAEESPGEMVLYMMIEHLVNSGFDYFDIGIGNERYKHSWCKNPETLYETILPLGLAARPMAFYFRTMTKLKEHIKTKPLLWNKVRQVRRLRAKLMKR